MARAGLQTRGRGRAGTFFPGFDFFDERDPTHGYISYVDQAQCEADGIVAVKDSGQVFMGVSGIRNKTKATKPRDSVRLTSKDAFTGGLFIVDIEHLPAGCGTWPAFWLCGPEWPSHGEIDIIEGVNNQQAVASTLHSSDGCSQAGAPTDFTGNRSVGKDGKPATDCWTDDPNQYGNQGCGISGAVGSYGAPFNSGGGGVFATLWDPSKEGSISMYFFKTGAVPADITARNPTPASWGLPYAKFDFGASCNAGHYSDMNIVFDLVLCGDWAGGVFGQMCPGLGSCNDFANNNPDGLKEAFWTINSLMVYQDSTK